jgi:endogenous inhibitor of DNA gyrase (YacG/DUF329 family)
VASWSETTGRGRLSRSSAPAEPAPQTPPRISKEGAGRRRRTSIGLADRIKDLTNWLADGEAIASQGYLTSDADLQHRPNREWWGQVMPGSWAPNIDADGVDGKLAGVAAIRLHDPAFDENVFLGQVQRLFFAVLEAWTSGKPALSQGVMAALIWQQQKTQIATYAQRGWRNVLETLSITSSVIAGARSDLDYDTLTVRINATSADYVVDSAGAVIHGDTTPWDWTEDWIFQRPSTLSTGQPGTITSQSCPNCGAAVNVDITSICPFCDAAVISGKFGWLLTRIDRI